MDLNRLIILNIVIQTHLREYRKIMFVCGGGEKTGGLSGIDLGSKEMMWKLLFERMICL